MQKSGIFEILEYSEPFHNCLLAHIQNPIIFTEISKTWVTLEIQNINNAGIFKTLTCFKRYTYAETSQIFNMECFARIVKSYYSFAKCSVLHLLKDFEYAHLSISTTLTCRMTSCNVLYETYLEPYHIQNPYIYGIQDIFRTLSRHIQAYPIMIIIVRALTSFHFNIFHKRFDMLSQCPTLSITKKANS